MSTSFKPRARYFRMNLQYQRPGDIRQDVRPARSPSLNIFDHKGRPLSATNNFSTGNYDFEPMPGAEPHGPGPEMAMEQRHAHHSRRVC